MSEHINDDAREELAKYDRRDIIEAMNLVDPSGLINTSRGYHEEMARNAKTTDPDNVQDTNDAYWLATNTEYQEAMDDMGDVFVQAVLAVIRLKAAERKVNKIHDEIKKRLAMIRDMRQQLESSDALFAIDFLPGDPQND